MTEVPVLTAVTGAAWESPLVASLERARLGVTVVRRCVDLPDLLAAAATGTARAVLLSADLRRLDRDALARLGAAGVAVVGLVTPGDETGERRLRQLGVGHVLAADSGVETVTAAVLEAVARVAEGTDAWSAAFADPLAALPRPPHSGADGPDGPEDASPPVDPGTGRLVAVWGPTGAPGRTTVAVNLAAELARLGTPVLLADADPYGGVIAPMMGLLDEAPGLAAAVRLANNGRLDLPGLARVARAVAPGFRVLTGVARADRWPELRPSGLEVVWSLARSLAAVTVVDCGFSLEHDEELSFDTAAPRRNGATLTTLESADVVLAVGSADPVGVQRLVRGLDALRETVAGPSVRVVLNRVRRGPIGADPERQLAVALDRYAGVSGLTFVPHDLAACDAALAAGRTLAEVAPDSPARAALVRLAEQLAGRRVEPPRRQRLAALRR